MQHPRSHVSTSSAGRGLGEGVRHGRVGRGAYLGQSDDLGVVNERLAVPTVRRQVARTRHLECLDDGRLARAILANDERERLVELDVLHRVGRERADAPDLQLVDRGHAWRAVAWSSCGRTDPWATMVEAGHIGRGWTSAVRRSAHLASLGCVSGDNRPTGARWARPCRTLPPGRVVFASRKHTPGDRGVTPPTPCS